MEKIVKDWKWGLVNTEFYVMLYSNDILSDNIFH